ncbi:Uu.00g106560.m01.CDS01 [Anthostomella pinea]|uniref:Uu.00g106560.m01.CDS01 n=1 Tax=Anthostomella pinea TaxID=933095 RepID=A0AAI8VF59_9PEZI|nr:Uu.00g106560.m01.CDS01 [Anthostomella pinea]
MDPVATLALFCNVLDLSERAVKTVQKAKEVYDSTTGLSKEQERLSEFTTEMTSIYEEISSSHKKLESLDMVLSNSEARIQNAAASCHNISVKVKSVLDRCMPKRPKSTRESVKATMRSLWTNQDLEDLQRQLDGSQEWIFDQSDKLLDIEPGLQITFVDWLREGRGIFHVAGKPGAGKSSLMKFICQHQMTRTLLTEWADGSKLISLTYFFWKADRGQSRLQGLKRCLVSDEIRQAPEIGRSLFPQVYDETNSELATAFSDKEVSQALQTLIGSAQVLENHRIFMVIDGLDEFDELKNAEDHDDFGSDDSRLG